VVRAAKPPFARTSRMLMRAGDGGIHAHVPADQLIHIGLALQLGQDPLPRAVALPSSEQSIDGLPRAVAFGHVPPMRTGPASPPDAIDELTLRVRRWPPTLIPTGSNGSSFAHC